MINDKILRACSFVVHLTISVDATEKPEELSFPALFPDQNELKRTKHVAIHH